MKNSCPSVGRLVSLSVDLSECTEIAGSYTLPCCSRSPFGICNRLYHSNIGGVRFQNWLLLNSIIHCLWRRGVVMWRRDVVFVTSQRCCHNLRRMSMMASCKCCCCLLLLTAAAVRQRYLPDAAARRRARCYRLPLLTAARPSVDWQISLTWLQLENQH